MNTIIEDITAHTHQIEQKLNHIDKLDEAYYDFKSYIYSEMDTHLDIKHTKFPTTTKCK